MAKWTSRDQIWNIALQKDHIEPPEMADNLGVSERTVRDTLSTMSDAWLLEKSGGEGREPVVYSTVVDHPRAEYEAPVPESD